MKYTETLLMILENIILKFWESSAVKPGRNEMQFSLLNGEGVCVFLLTFDILVFRNTMVPRWAFF